MAYDDKTVGWKDLIKLNASGIKVEDYPKVRIALQNAFKSVYGDDIDLSTGTADGVYVDIFGLLLNNMLQMSKRFYNDLNINTAAGTALENLCALSNVSRKGASYSTATLLVTLTDAGGATEWTTSSISFLDQNGKVWTLNEETTFELNVQTEIVVTCETLGPVTAPAGWINKLVTNEVVMEIVQEDPANVGSWVESDSSLRARRNQTLGMNGKTVLQALAGELMGYSGISDVLIYNNNTITSDVAKDGTTVYAHSIYVVIRRNENISLKDSTIGSAIYSKLTPGIGTCEFSGDESTGTSHTYSFKQYVMGKLVNEGVDQPVYWKVAKAQSPEIVITIKPNSYFASASNSTPSTIAQNVIDEMNDIHLGDDVEIRDIENIVINSDPLFRGNKTYSLESLTINGSDEDYENKDFYFEYYIENVEYTYNDDNVVITIKGN